ncbi:MAG: hypothetical protein JST93_13915 [Acidobacteria bacterium]|nr:hypothetical protein [Acidobacteriota bacterium]
MLVPLLGVGRARFLAGEQTLQSAAARSERMYLPKFTLVSDGDMRDASTHLS